VLEGGQDLRQQFLGLRRVGAINGVHGNHVRGAPGRFVECDCGGTRGGRRPVNTYGIYGQKDYNAWIGKITCKRLSNGVDQDAGKSANFVFQQLQRGSTTAQAWQFLGAALRTYCPDKLPVLEAAAQQ